MKYRNSIIIILVLITGLLVTIFTRKEVKTSYYDDQISAALKVEEAFLAIKEERINLGIEIDETLDPLQTGLIGDIAPLEGYSITTTLGMLPAKKTSTNPNFAGLIIKYLKTTGLKAGDEVAVNFSSSFPALNIQTIIALDVLELKSVIQTSIGASTYGANIIDFTYLDMENHLFDLGIINRKSDLISLGGEKDVLEGISLNDDYFINSLYQRYDQYDQVSYTNLEKNVKYRYSYYQDRLENIKIFINVGGNWASQGEGLQSYPNGLNKLSTMPITKKSGLINYFTNDYIPIINLLNIEDLAMKNEMERNKDIPYEIGKGLGYYEVYYNKYLIVISILLVYGLFYLDLFERNQEKIINEGLNENKTNWSL